MQLKHTRTDLHSQTWPQARVVTLGKWNISRWAQPSQAPPHVSRFHESQVTYQLHACSMADVLSELHASKQTPVLTARPQQAGSIAAPRLDHANSSKRTQEVQATCLLPQQGLLADHAGHAEACELKPLLALVSAVQCNLPRLVAQLHCYFYSQLLCCCHAPTLQQTGEVLLSDSYQLCAACGHVLPTPC